jgi:hypothetical protein
MAVAFASAGSYPSSPFNVGSGGSYAVPYPTGIVANAPLVLCVVGVPGKAITTPSGWTAKTSNIGTGVGISVFERLAVGSETGSLTVSVASGQLAIGAAVMIRVSGAATSPFGAGVVATGTSSTTSPTNGTLSPAPGTSDLVMRFYAYGQTTGSTTSSLTLSATGGFTQQFNQVNKSSSANPGILVATLVAGTANDVVTANAAGSWAVVDVAFLAPSAANPAAFLPFFT